MGIEITEERYLALKDAESTLLDLQTKYPGILEGKFDKRSPLLKKHKDMLQKLVNKVEEVANHPSFKGIFEVAYVHGFKYNGPNFAEVLEEAKKVLK